MTDILLFYASFGDGHKQVAAALKTELEQRGASVAELDCFRAGNRMVATVSESVYEWTTRYWPSAYGASYRLTANVSPNSRFWALLSATSRRAALAALREHKPSAVIQLFPDHALSTLPAGLPKPHLSVVLTDYSVHSRWFHRGVDTYFLPSETVVRAARRYMTDRAEVVVSGIPIRPGFGHCNRVRDPKSFVIDTPYVVLATGGRGVFPDLSLAITAIRRALPEHAVYVMCGRNSDMLSRVESIGQTVTRVYGLPFQEDVATWLQRADFAMIKSGGVTVGECLAAGCPAIVYRPQMGQEADNARYLDAANAGVSAYHLDDLERLLRQVRAEGRLAEMVKACALEARPDAAQRVARHVLSRLT